MIQESDLPQKGNGWKYEKNILIQKVTSGIKNRWIQGIACWFSGQDSVLLLLRVQVRSLAGELISYELHGAAKKKKRLQRTNEQGDVTQALSKGQQRRLEREGGEVKRLGGWTLTCRSRRRPARA